MLARVLPVAVVAGLIAVLGMPSVAAADCGSPANPVVAENCRAGHPAERVGHQRRRQLDHPGLRDRHQRRTWARRSTSRSTRRRPPTGSTSTAWATTAATARAWSTPSRRRPRCRRASPRARPRRDRARSTAATGRRRRPGRCPRTPSRASTSRTSCGPTGRRREPHPVRRPQRRRPLGPVLPDLGHDLAGLQPVRRQQPLRRRPRHRSEPRLQGELQPPDHDPRDVAGGLRVQRRVPDDPLARAQRLRRQLHHRRRHRPTRRPDPQPPGLPLGRPRRVLVGDPARERRGGARRRREPRLLQRQRGVLEDPLGERQPDARLLQGDAQQRQDRPARERLDRVVARSARRSTPRGRSPRTRSRAPCSPSTRATARSRCRRRTAGSASGAAAAWRARRRPAGRRR